MKRKVKLPRAPLPRQVEKVHQKKSKDRKVKHPKAGVQSYYVGDPGDEN